MLNADIMFLRPLNHLHLHYIDMLIFRYDTMNVAISCLLLSIENS